MDSELTFWDHISELRSRLIRIMIGLVAASCLAYGFWEKIWFVIAYPLTKQHLHVDLIATSPMETLMTSFKMSLISGAIISFPWIMWNVWRFLAPGLFANEKRVFGVAFFSSIIMFAVGACFAYFAVLPAGLAFLATYTKGAITQNWRQGDFASFISQFMLAFGVIFELPVVAYVLANMGLITAGGMWRFFRYAIIVIFAVAAILTPGPDPVSQIMMAVPLVILYVISIGICAMAQKKQARQETEATA
ncbi:MAG: Twin-arginine translocation protein TatC [Fibrobacteres bacterium]|nr:Twin-arginine translocation protein TatC [Fibrobacterota bacterium]